MGVKRRAGRCLPAAMPAPRPFANTLVTSSKTAQPKNPVSHDMPLPERAMRSPRERDSG